MSPQSLSDMAPALKDGPVKRSKKKWRSQANSSSWAAMKRKLKERRS